MKHVRSRFAILTLVLVVLLTACDGANHPLQSDNSRNLSGNTGNWSSSVLATDEVRVEARFSGLESISSFGTTYHANVARAQLLPRGSALMTSSGNLNARGIEHIIHAASGSSVNGSPNFIPTLEGVRLSVINSLLLARTHGIPRVAIPFIGRGIFLGRIGANQMQLAETIVRAALESRDIVNVTFVIIGRTGPGSDYQLFLDTLQNVLADPAVQANPAISGVGVEVVNGGILNFNLHRSAAIVNAANMEVTFGNGISGAIGNATGSIEQINQEARSLVGAFNQRVLQTLGN